MGDMAEWILEQGEIYEQQVEEWLVGRMGDVEAYELGIIDELGYPLDATGYQTKVCWKSCKYCGAKWLFWKQTANGGWRLFDSKSGELHGCNEYAERQGRQRGGLSSD